jgi:hypothetical protein
MAPRRGAKRLFRLKNIVRVLLLQVSMAPYEALNFTPLGRSKKHLPTDENLGLSFELELPSYAWRRVNRSYGDK